MKLLTLAITVFALFLSINFGAISTQAQIVENGGFETGDFTGWETFRMDVGGDWYVYSGNMVIGAEVLPPPVGTYAASTEQGDPSSQVLIQDLELPSSDSIQCSVIYYYQSNADFATPPTLEQDIIDSNQQARIDIIEAEAPPFNVTDGVIENLFQTQPGDPTEVGYTTLNFDLSEYAGTTVSFRAAEVDNRGGFNFSIDNLVCGENINSKPIPTLGQWGLIAMAGLMAIAAILVIRKRRFQVG